VRPGDLKADYHLVVLGEQLLDVEVKSGNVARTRPNASRNE